MASHHERLKEIIAALEAGKVRTASGRGECLQALKQLLDERKNHWELTLECSQPEVQTYIHEVRTSTWPGMTWSDMGNTD